MSGMPLHTGDSAVEGAAGTVEMIRRQRADKRLLETLEETARKYSATSTGHILSEGSIEAISCAED